MRPAEWQVQYLEEFEKLNEVIEWFPRGVLFELSVNPYNGNMVIKWQGSHEAITVLHSAFSQLMRQYLVRESDGKCSVIPFNRFGDLEAA